MNSGEFRLEDNFSDVFYDELNDEIIFAIQYEFGNTQESQGYSAEFTSTVRQGRQDGLNLLHPNFCLLYTSPSPRDKRQSRMPSSA